MRAGFKLAVSLTAGVLCISAVGRADTPTAPHPADTPATTHRAHKAKKAALPPPLPSGTRGPVPQIPLDSMPAVPPQINYQDGQLTIVAPNSTLGDILRGVRKHTSADIDIPSNATERVATSLGPGPARDVVAQLLNGSHFNYILLGSPENAGLLVRVVLVAKTPDTPAAPNAQVAKAPAPAPAADAADADAADEAVEETPDQAAEAEQQQTTPDQPGVKTPQQMLQEMQQRQLQMQQNGQAGAAAQPGQAGQPGYPPPGMPLGQRPQPPPQQQDQQQQ
jgi:hypothetical protein